MLVAGTLLEEGLETVSDFIVVRYLPDGTLDPSFAVAGILRLEHHYATCDPTFAAGGEQAISTSDSWIKGLALQADGKIVVGGYVSTDDYIRPKAKFIGSFCPPSL